MGNYCTTKNVIIPVEINKLTILNHKISSKKIKNNILLLEIYLISQEKPTNLPLSTIIDCKLLIIESKRQIIILNRELNLILNLYDLEKQDFEKKELEKLEIEEINLKKI